MRHLLTFTLVGLLSACGGGGGSNWLSLPESVTVSLYEGESTQVNVTGVAASEPSIPVNVGVYVDGNLFDPSSVSIDQSSGVLSMTLHARTLSSLSVDTHTGRFEVRVCEDDPGVCSRPYDKSPWYISVTIRVAEDPGNPTSPTNGDFSSGTNGWTLSLTGSTDGAILVDNGELFVNLNNPGQSSSSGEVLSPDINLEAGKTYRLTFDGLALYGRRPMLVAVTEGRDKDGDGIVARYPQSLRDVYLETSKQTFSRDFTVPETNRTAKLALMVGGFAGPMHFDNITVTEVP